MRHHLSLQSCGYLAFNALHEDNQFVFILWHNLPRTGPHALGAGMRNKSQYSSNVWLLPFWIISAWWRQYIIGFNIQEIKLYFIICFTILPFYHYWFSGDSAVIKCQIRFYSCSALNSIFPVQYLHSALSESCKISIYIPLPATLPPNIKLGYLNV